MCKNGTKIGIALYNLGGVIDIVDEQSSQIVVLLLPVWAAEQ
jgi:hypothetical protein